MSSEASVFHLRVLGSPSVSCATGTGLVPIKLQPKRLALLAYLALSTEGTVQRGTLLAMFWPESDEARARNSLNQALHGLRTSLGPGLFVSGGPDGVTLTPGYLRCDVHEFRTAIAQCSHERALDVYRDGLLEGLRVPGVDDFERWVDATRERLRDQACTAARALVEQCERRGDWAAALHWNGRLLEVSELDEDVLRRQISLFDRTGNRPEALRLYLSFSRKLAEDWDLEPSVRTQEMIARVRLDADRSSSGLRDPGTGDLYLRGLYHRHKRAPDDLMKAIECFRAVTEREPRFEPAHAALALTYALAGQFFYGALPPRSAHALASTALEEALAQGGRYAETHTALGVVRLFYEWDWAGAEEALRRATTMDPRNVYALAHYSNWLVLQGRFDEALETMARAEAIDPHFLLPRIFGGVWNVVARRYRAAAVRLTECLEMEPAAAPALVFLGDCHRFSGEHGAAQRMYARAEDHLGSSPLLLARRAALSASYGHPRKARSLLAPLRNPRAGTYVAPSLIAEVELALNEVDAAYASFDRAIEERDTQMPLLAVWPGFDGARDHPRYRSLLAAVGLSA